MNYATRRVEHRNSGLNYGKAKIVYKGIIAKNGMIMYNINKALTWVQKAHHSHLLQAEINASQFHTLTQDYHEHIHTNQGLFQHRIVMNLLAAVWCNAKNNDIEDRGIKELKLKTTSSVAKCSRNSGQKNTTQYCTFTASIKSSINQSINIDQLKLHILTRNRTAKKSIAN